jgi:hypothetical protein
MGRVERQEVGRSAEKQIKEELKSEMKAGTGDNKEEDGDKLSADDATGKEFGRGAHKAKKQKEGQEVTVRNCCHDFKDGLCREL